MGVFFLYLTIDATLGARPYFYAGALAVGVACRENLIVLGAFNVVSVLRTAGERGRSIPWGQTLVTNLIPVAAVILYHTYPIFIPDSDHSIIAVMRKWGTEFLMGPNRQMIIPAGYLGSLGMLAVVPLIFRHSFGAFLKRRPEWTIYVLITLALSILGGLDIDRFALWQTPAIVMW